MLPRGHAIPVFSGSVDARGGQAFRNQPTVACRERNGRLPPYEGLRQKIAKSQKPPESFLSGTFPIFPHQTAC